MNDRAAMGAWWERLRFGILAGGNRRWTVDGGRGSKPVHQPVLTAEEIAEQILF